MTHNPTWAEQQVMLCAGIPKEDQTEELAQLAEIALSRCYYIQTAAEYFLKLLGREP